MRRPGYIETPTFRNSLREISEYDLTELWTKELTKGIEGTSIRAGFIKLAMSDDGPTAAGDTKPQSCSQGKSKHRRSDRQPYDRGKSSQEGNGYLGRSGSRPASFYLGPRANGTRYFDPEDAARRGAYVELDSVGAPYQSQPELLETDFTLIEAGFTSQLLLSHDAGWYNPARVDGLPDEGYRGYTALVKDFIPALLKRGITRRTDTAYHGD